MYEAGRLALLCDPVLFIESELGIFFLVQWSDSRSPIYRDHLSLNYTHDKQKNMIMYLSTPGHTYIEMLQ